MCLGNLIVPVPGVVPPDSLAVPVFVAVHLDNLGGQVSSENHFGHFEVLDLAEDHFDNPEVLVRVVVPVRQVLDEGLLRLVLVSGSLTRI